MSASPLFDVPGPKAKARIRIITWLSIAVFIALFAGAVNGFYQNGQLQRQQWVVFTLSPILKILGEGLWGTIQLALVAMVITVPIGIALAFGRESRVRVVRWLCGVYVEFFRAVPTMLKILFFVAVLPSLGLNLPLFWKVIIPIVLGNTASLCEVFRAGIRALPAGQLEAGYSVGMTRGQVQWLIVLPQALRIVIPSLVSLLISLLKDTTLAYVASFYELMTTGSQIINAATANVTVQTYLVLAAIYVIMCLGLSQVAKALERRLDRRGLAHVNS